MRIDRARPKQLQILDVTNSMNRIGKAEADPGQDRIVPSPPVSLTTVIRIVDHIGVVASAPNHRVEPQTSIEMVVATTAYQDVVTDVSDQSIVEL